MELNFQLKPEDEFILCCIRTQSELQNGKKIKSLLENDLDWDYIFQMALKNGLIPLLHNNINTIPQKEIPELILNKINDKFNDNVIRNLFLTAEMIKILKLLESHGIYAIPYKGPVLAILAYGDVSLRHFRDIDIFINKSDIPKVRDLMISRRYVFESYPDHINESLYFKTQSEHKFIDRKRNIVVEMHNKFQGHFFSFPTSPDFLYSQESLQKVNINKNQFCTLSNEHLILILSIHCARHDWSRLLWIYDLLELVQNHKIEWANVISNAKKLCVLRILLINLLLASDLFGLKLPDEISNCLEKDSHVEKICLKIKKKIFCDVNTTLNIFEKTLLDLRKRENIKYGFTDVVISLTRPTYVDFEEIHLPSSLYFLYYLIRPFLLLKRYGKDPI